LRWGERLLAAYRKAAEDRLKARAAAEANCPPVPEELVCNGAFWRGCTETECDVEGEEIKAFLVDGEDGKKYEQLPREILNSQKTKAAIAEGRLYCDRRTKFGKNVRLIETAEKYESEQAAAIERSGLSDAMQWVWEAAYDIGKLAYEARDIEPQTMAGVLIQARALTAYANVEIEVGHYRGRAGQLAGLALAQSLTRLSA